MSAEFAKLLILFKSSEKYCSKIVFFCVFENPLLLLILLLKNLNLCIKKKYNLI